MVLTKQNTKEKFVKDSKLYYRIQTKITDSKGEIKTKLSKWIKLNDDTLNLGSLIKPTQVYEFRYFVPQKNKKMFRGFFN